MAVRNEAEACECFGGRYAAPVLPAALEVERAALGSDFGANGFTTMTQADELAREVRIGPGDQLLDLGAGCGWPGLRVTTTTGCNTILSDLTVSGMSRGLHRSRNDGLGARVNAVAASARHLPFRPESFDAVVHSDLLCCVTAKLSVLKACRNVLRPGARMACFTIELPPGLSKAEHRRAVRAGPPAVSARRESSALLTQAGFSEVRQVDVTSEFGETAQAWYDAAERHRAELRPADPELFDQRQRDRRQMLAAIDAGWLRRSLLAGVRPLD